MNLRALLIPAAILSLSSQAHQLGRVSRPVLDPIKTCTEKSGYPEARAYVRALATALAAGSPEVFKGEYALEKFCFNIVDQAGIGANADPENREVNVRIDTFRETQDDAQIASVLAHEMGHVLLQHPGVMGAEIRPSTLPFNLSDDPIYMDLLRRKKTMSQKKMDLEQRDRDLKGQRYRLKEQLEASGLAAAERASIESQLAPLEEQITKLDDVLYPLKDEYDVLYTSLIHRERELFPQSVKVGWEEQEADEIGFELLNRSGFRPEAFTEVLMMLVDEKDRPACADRIQKAEADATLAPKRILGEIATHPEACWRAYNISVLETRSHGADYLRVRRATPSMGHALADVRAEVGAR